LGGRTNLVAADIIVGPLSDHAAHLRRGRLLLNDDGYYWFLYRYFEAANLDRGAELIDLYGGAELAGYQLERLAEELQQALRDVEAGPAEWNGLGRLVGDGEDPRDGDPPLGDP